jgi:BirA family transcriptional regulator, biotin operon repressor / biotin---[acetyl-CoA-carboxylase] ligase
VQHDFVLVGIGVNLLHSTQHVDLKATSCEALGIRVTSQEFMRIMLAKFTSFYNAWVDHGFPTIRSQWLEIARGIEDTLIVHSAGKKMEGIFIDLDDVGNLLLMVNSKVEKIAVGDVFFKD